MEGKTVLYFQAFRGGVAAYGVIAGYKAGEPYRAEWGASAIKVRMVPWGEQEGIRAALRDKLVGPISFWAVLPLIINADLPKEPGSYRGTCHVPPVPRNCL